jgi:hypothetical protein
MLVFFTPHMLVTRIKTNLEKSKGIPVNFFWAQNFEDVTIDMWAI